MDCPRRHVTGGLANRRQRGGKPDSAALYCASIQLMGDFGLVSSWLMSVSRRRPSRRLRMLSR
jgi:hypothetical protein